MSSKSNFPYTPFSYDEYRHILQQLLDNLPILDYAEINNETGSFCIIRHDVEFSLERALKLAIIEHEMDVKASYFIQLNNSTYNAISHESLNIIRKISELGHKIGIHFSPSSSNVDLVKQEFYFFRDLFENRLNKTIDRFSFHRPNLNPQLLQNNIKIDGVINAYSDLYFEYFDGNVPKNPVIKYISDSNHQWKYGHPLDVIESDCKKVHILIHPFSWSRIGGDNLANYQSLLEEKNNSLMISINSEISNFPFDEIMKNNDV